MTGLIERLEALFTPEDCLADNERYKTIRDAIDALSPSQSERVKELLADIGRRAARALTDKEG